MTNALQPDTEIDMDYYIEKQIIPAIDRFLGAVDNKLKISPENYLKKAKINEDSTVSDDLNVEDNNICIICGQELRHIFKLLHLYRNLVDSKFHGENLKVKPYLHNMPNLKTKILMVRWMNFWKICLKVEVMKAMKWLNIVPSASRSRI